MAYIKCACGNFISDDIIDFFNSENEEGEEYGEVNISCAKCGETYEAWQWGQFEDKNEAIDFIQDYINDTDR